jgi:outer membrane lipoprotein-sorting protein
MRIFSTAVLSIGLALALPLDAAAQKLPLNDISAYLNKLQTAKGEFTQINDDGSISTGTIYIKRPGKVRFEYNPPETALVVAGSNTVVIFDKKSNQPAVSPRKLRRPLENPWSTRCCAPVRSSKRRSRPFPSF